MTTDYTKLDQAIVEAIRDGAVGFALIVDLVESKVDEHVDLGQPKWRTVDRRLQALRKQGSIEHRDNPRGWRVVEKGAAG